MNTPLNFNPPETTPSNRLAMAPLVDIVLLLICFYLLVMNSMQSRAEVPLTLPAVQYNNSSEIVPTELVINIDPEGQIILNGSPVPSRQLQNLIASQQHGPESVRVTIRADAGLRFELLNDVMDACRDAGITMITLRTIEERQTP